MKHKLWHFFPTLCSAMSCDSIHGGNIYTTEIGKCTHQSFTFFSREPVVEHLLPPNSCWYSLLGQSNCNPFPDSREGGTGHVDKTMRDETSTGGQLSLGQ